MSDPLVVAFPASGCPFTDKTPLSNGVRPLKQFNNDVLPEPDGLCVLVQERERERERETYEIDQSITSV
jgi:hypothetical protein